MINLEAIFEKQNPQDGKLPEWAKNFTLEVCQQVLELAAENAEITIVNEWDGIETGNKKVVVVDKQSILDVINQVK